MTEEQIIIAIDASQLKALRLELGLIEKKAAKTFGRGKRLDRILPSINRDLRLILGQIPGMRPVMQAYFAYGLRPERGWAYYKKALAEGNPALMMNVYLVAIATVMRLWMDIQRYLKKIKEEERKYELSIRRARGWTREEFTRGTKEWENYLKGLPP